MFVLTIMHVLLRSMFCYARALSLKPLKVQLVRKPRHSTRITYLCENLLYNNMFISFDRHGLPREPITHHTKHIIIVIAMQTFCTAWRQERHDGSNDLWAVLWQRALSSVCLWRLSTDALLPPSTPQQTRKESGLTCLHNHIIATLSSSSPSWPSYVHIQFCVSYSPLLHVAAVAHSIAANVRHRDARATHPSKRCPHNGRPHQWCAPYPRNRYHRRNGSSSSVPANRL